MPVLFFILNFFDFTVAKNRIKRKIMLFTNFFSLHVDGKTHNNCNAIL